MRKKIYLSIFIFIVLIKTTSFSFADEPYQQKNHFFEINLRIGEIEHKISNETIFSWFSYSSKIIMLSEFQNEIIEPSYCNENKFICSILLTEQQKRNIHLVSDTSINKNSIKSYLEDLARNINREPVDAKFSIENGKVTTFEPAKDGLLLDIDKNIEIIYQALLKKETNSGFSEIVELDYNKKRADVDYANVNDIGISSIIGEGISNFKGSPSNRIHNIKVATERFNGVLIKPNEEFSFVKILGEVDGDHGYLPELVIKQGVTEPEFGGGVCQVSTTVFRAAIYSGLKITARKNHAYPVSYYNPQGMDSTIYVPQPDLKFTNNTPNHILIQAKIVGTSLTFTFYGTDDGRKTIVDGPKIIEKQPDGALKTTFSQKVTDKNGNEFINDIFNSSYASPYKYPHPGGPTLQAKPSNWSNDEWKAYKQMLKDISKTNAKKN